RGGRLQFRAGRLLRNALLDRLRDAAPPKSSSALGFHQPSPENHGEHLTMGTLLLGVVVVLNLILLGLLLGLIRRITSSSQTTELQVLANESVALRESLAQKFSAATADMAMRLESTKGELRRGVTDRFDEGLNE